MTKKTLKVFLAAAVFGFTVALGACAGCDDEVTGDEADGDAGFDVGDPDDADETGDPDTEDDTADDGDTGDPDAGDDGDTGESDTGDDNGDDNGDEGDDGDEDDVCPLPYQQECDDECVSTNTDIDHCGECANECDSDEACVGGECTTECMGDLQLCDNRCVDYDIDSDHCGQCDNPCDDGQGCSDGTCVESADLGPAPDECDDGGPPIDVDFGDGETDQCTGDLADSTFMWALCTCGDLTTEDEFLTDGFNSTSGPYQPGGLGGGVGVNGEFATESEAEIWGALHVGEPSPVHIGDETDIRQQLHAGDDFEAGDTCTVGDDAYIAGDIIGSGLDVSATLYSPDDADRDGGINYGDLVEQPVTVDPPCACDDDDQIPIQNIVAAAESPNNDNALIGLDEDLMTGGDTPERVDLPCGEYYLSEIDADGDVTIVADGKVVLHIDGDIDLEGELTITPGPTGELDVFVAGNIHSDTGFTLGSPNYPASTRLYLGGEDGMTLSGESQIGANIYAVPGMLMIEDSLDMYGALYATDAVFESELFIHYDRHVLQSGQACPDPDDDDDGDNGDDDNGDDDNGDDDNGDDDNGDDDEPVCYHDGESCDGDDDCCAPLICDQETNTCTLMECLSIGETCNYDDECCSGTCAMSTGDDQGSCLTG